MLQALLIFSLSLLLAQEPSAKVLDAEGQTLDAHLSAPHLMDLGSGRSLNVFCIGQGSPTVLFEQGGEGNIGNWRAVQPAISAITRTCLYDRAGFGYSDPPDQAVTAFSVTDDLRALVVAAKIEGPLILVGHSAGGLYATVYADRFSDDVAGLVLVEPAFSGQEQWRTAADLEADLPNIQRGEASLLKCAELARAGSLSRETLGANGCFPVSAQASPGETAYLLHAVTGPAWYEAEYSQSINMFSRDGNLSLSQGQEASVRRSFGALPVEVLSAARPPSSSWRDPDRSLVAGQHWQNGHRLLAERSDQGHWQIVEGAGHFIQRDQPQAVIDAIERVIVATRANAAE